METYNPERSSLALSHCLHFKYLPSRSPLMLDKVMFLGAMQSVPFESPADPFVLYKWSLLHGRLNSPHTWTEGPTWTQAFEKKKCFLLKYLALQYYLGKDELYKYGNIFIGFVSVVLFKKKEKTKSVKLVLGMFWALGQHISKVRTSEYLSCSSKFFGFSFEFIDLIVCCLCPFLDFIQPMWLHLILGNILIDFCVL